MSSDEKDTKTRILDNARLLFENSNGDLVRVSDIAKKTNLSRQSIYLHFGSRTGLLIALVRYVDQQHRFDELVEKVSAQANAEKMLACFIKEWGNYLPHIGKIAQAMYHQQSTDEDAAEAWKDRMDAFMALCLMVTRKISTENRLADNWNIDSAAEFVWSLTSIRTWRELTEEQGWSSDTYITHMHHILTSSLLKQRTPVS